MKKKFTAILCLISALSFAQVPTNGLVAKYSFNVNQNPLEDSHTGTYTLTNSGTVSNGYDIYTNPGQAANFDGSNDLSVNDAAFRTASFSISTWFKYTSLQAYSTIAAVRYNTSTAPYNSFNLYTGSNPGGKLCLAVYNGTTESVYQSNTVLSSNKWYYATASYDAVTGRLCLYLNGILQTSATFTGGISYNPSNNPFVIGNIPNTANNGFIGSIDEMLFYNRALTGTEALYLYQYYLASRNITEPNQPLGLYEIGRFNFNGYFRDHSIPSQYSGNSALTNSNAGLTTDRLNNPIGAASTGSVQFAYASNNSFYSPDTAITVLGWTKRTSSTTNGLFVSKRRNPTTAPINSYALGCGSAIAGYNDKLIGTISTSNNTDVFVGDNNTIVDNTWYFVAMTYSSGKGELKFYVDGNLTETKNVTGNIVYSTSYPLVLGGANQTNFHWNGAIDDIRIFNMALSSSQIDSIKNLMPVTSGLISHYPMGKNPFDAVSRFDLGNVDLQTADRYYTPANATNFNGATVITPDYSPLHKPDTAITIEAWVYKTADQQYNSVGGIRANQSTVPYNSAMLIAGGNNNGNKLQGVISTISNSDVILQSTGTFPNNGWVHIGLTYSAAQGKAKLYINGTKVDEKTASGNIYYTAGQTQRLAFGNASSNPLSNQYFTGKIDEFKIYNRAKTEQEFSGDFCIAATPTISTNLYTCYSSPSFTLSGTPSGGTFDGVDIVGNTFSPSTHTVGSYDYSYTVTQNGCTASKSGTINIQGNPSVTVSQSGNQLTGNFGYAGSMQWYNCDSQTDIPGETNFSYYPSSAGNYAIIVAVGACKDTSNCYNYITTDINTVTKSEISVYPNPTHEVLTIESGTQNESYNIQITNYLGEIIYQNESTLSNTKINVKDWHEGIYVISITNASINLVKKILVQ